jgi:hypothetical protein
MTEAQATAGTSVLSARGVVRRFHEGTTTLEVLRGLELDVLAGAFAAGVHALDDVGVR